MTLGPVAKMVALDALLEQLAQALMTDVGESSGLLRLQVDAVDVTVPVETAMRPAAADKDRGAQFRATLPRARLRTGFEQPLGQLRLRFERTGER